MTEEEKELILKSLNYLKEKQGNIRSKDVVSTMLYYGVSDFESFGEIVKSLGRKNTIIWETIDDFTFNGRLKNEHFKEYLIKLDSKQVRVHEATELAIKANNGDEESKLKLVNGSIRTIFKIAKNYKTDFISFEDLMQEGLVALLEALQKFKYKDPNNCEFYGFSSLCILGRMSRVESNLIKLTEGAKENIDKVQKYLENSELNPWTSGFKICDNLGISYYDKYLEILPFIENNVYFDKEEDMNEVQDSASIDDYIMLQDLREVVNSSLEILGSRLGKHYEMILKLRFGIIKVNCLSCVDDKVNKFKYGGISCDSCGLLFNISSTRIGQLQEKALKELRKPKYNLEELIY